MTRMASGRNRKSSARSSRTRARARRRFYLWAAIGWLLASGGVAWLLAERAHASGSSVPPVPSIPSPLPPIPSPSPSPLPVPTPYPGSPIIPLPIEPSPTPYPGTTPKPPCGQPGGCGGGACLRALPQSTADPIFLRAGAVVEQAIDLSLPGPAPGWVAARTYSSRVTGSGALGSKWLSDYVDYRLVQEGAYNVALIVNAASKRLFSFVPYPSPGYTSPGDSTLTLVQDGANAQFIVTDWQSGEVNIFHNFYATHPGKLKEKTSLARRAASQAGSVYTYNASHQVTQVTTGAGQEYNIVFTYSGSKITKIEVRTGADTATRIRQVEYTYYDSQTHSQNLGADGDLVQVAIARCGVAAAPGRPPTGSCGTSSTATAATAS